jgi:cholecystokinin A receptor/hypocretin (orexin) receptor 2
MHDTNEGAAMWPSAATPTPRNNNEHILVYLATIAIIGTVGNLLVVIVYARKKDKQTSTFFILVLALADLTVCSVLVPFTAFMEGVVFATSSSLVCKLYFFLTTTTVPNSSLLMTAIAFDRFFCICHVNRVILTLPRARWLVLTLVVISGLLGVIPSLSSTVVPIYPHGENNSSGYFYEGDVAAAANSSNNESSLSAHTVCTIDVDTETWLGQLVWQFKLFYDMVYAGSVIVITLLYILIYKAIYVRRRIKRNRKLELLRNGCVVLTAGVDEVTSDNSINRVIAITKPKVMNNGAGGSSGGGGHGRLSEDANLTLALSRTRPSLKKCYCYFDSNQSMFTLNFYFHTLS